MERVLQPELLDELPADDPRAIRSRRDLCRVNAWMENAAIVAGAVRESFPEAPRRIIEIGAGDGKFLLQVARHLGARSMAPQTNALLVDRQALLQPETQEHFERFNWKVCAVKADVFDFFESRPESADVVIANLFLHHFSDERLTELLRRVREKSRVMIAVEPRRSRFVLFCCRLLWLIGSNAVTRHDALVSVRAGFGGQELSAFWLDNEGWHLTEQPTGLFSHLFVARRKD